MKKVRERLKGYVAGFLSAVLVCTVVMAVGASGVTKEVFYNGVKLYVDGAEIVPRDASGAIVEPFIMDGSTYLPVRAVAQALGVDVHWEGETQSVYLGKRTPGAPDNYLDRIQHSNVRVGSGVSGNSSTVTRINNPVTDAQDVTYTNGVMLESRGAYRVTNDPDGAQIIVDYPLNSQYSTLNGKAVLLVLRSGGSAVDIYVYGDGRLLHTVSHLTTSMPHDFSVSVSGVNTLTIKVSGGGIGGTVALTDLALYR